MEPEDAAEHGSFIVPKVTKDFKERQRASIMKLDEVVLCLPHHKRLTQLKPDVISARRSSKHSTLSTLLFVSGPRREPTLNLEAGIDETLQLTAFESKGSLA